MKEIRLLTLSHKGLDYNIEFFERKSNGPTILFLHGLGGAKENFDWAVKHKGLNEYNLISFDNPGTGNSSYYRGNNLNIDDLTDITYEFINRVIDRNFFLVGASMGGLTLIKYMEKYQPNNVLGLINIEGNLMMEDCMFSSKVIHYDLDTFRTKGFRDCIAEMRKNPTCGYHTIANNLELNTNSTAYYDYSFQTVEYSRSGKLFHAFVNFDFPKLFLHGDKNNTLSYLPLLHQSDVIVEEISGSDHFLFYDNPDELYLKISTFIKQTRK